MSKTAFLFPGQGSQYVGMGQELAASYREARDVFQNADERLGFSLSTLCFSGPKKKLVQTVNTQPAILTTSIAALAVLDAYGAPAPDYVAGHSLGEYSALVAARSLDFDDAVSLVRLRGRLMEEAFAGGTGTMAAVIGLSSEEIMEICRQARYTGVVEPANYNCPGQVVIAGELAAVRKAGEIALQSGAKRVVELSVSGPFHSSLMRAAAEKLRDNLERTPFADLRMPVISNVTASAVTSGNEAREHLVTQVCHPVRWQESMEMLVAQGVDTFVEIGPGKVLGGLVKRVSKAVKVLNVEDRASLEAALSQLKR